MQNPQLSNLSKADSSLRLKERSKMFRRSILSTKTDQELDSKIEMYEKYHFRIKCIDIFTMIFDLVTIYTFYFEHFSYINNGYELSSTNNVIRLTLLGSTLTVCIGILLRFLFRFNSDKILQELGEGKKEVILVKEYRVLIAEIVIHLIQPYPYVAYKFNMMILGQEVTYTINLLFFFFCTLRSYMLIKVIRYWNLYSKKRSKKILAFFSPNSNSDYFLYKANLSSNGFFTLTLLGFVTLIICSLLLQTFEYLSKDPNNPFYYYWNSLWYLVVTMTTSKQRNNILII